MKKILKKKHFPPKKKAKGQTKMSKEEKSFEEKVVAAMQLQQSQLQNDMLNFKLKGPDTLAGSIILPDTSMTYYPGSSQTIRPMEVKRSEPKPKTPQEIVGKLSEKVIGQDRAKKALAIGAYYHYHRINSGANKIKKSNICLIGPTGTGKTYLLETLAEVLGVPFLCVDATELTPDGYIGLNVSNCLSGISCQEAQNIEHAIIFIDEADKLSGAGSDSGFKTTQIQQSLLKMIEGKRAKNTRGSIFGGEGSSIDTSKMLFVMGGAFSGITARKDYNGEVTPFDLTKYGLMPEFVGRFPVIATLDALSVEDLATILTEPKDSLLSEFKEIFKSHKVELEFTKEALKVIAMASLKFGTGARGIRAVIESVLQEHLFQLPTLKGKTVTICDGYILNTKTFGETYGKPGTFGPSSEKFNGDKGQESLTA